MAKGNGGSMHEWKEHETNQRIEVWTCARTRTVRVCVDALIQSQRSGAERGAGVLIDKPQFDGLFCIEFRTF